MAFTSLSDLRKSRGGFDKLVKEVERISAPQGESSSKDDRFWQPEVDKAGNGYAVIRFLPPSKGEEFPFVRVWKHAFQGPTGKWYIENSLTTIGKNDPVGELNQELWNSGIEANKEVARKQKRKLEYIVNILVVSDSKRPENEGKVFLYKFGKKIWDKIKDVTEPQFEDEKPLNPFDFWEGANFKLKIRNVEGYRNYDKSEFDKPSALSEDDADIERIWSQQHSLIDFHHERHFKSYDELKKKLDSVLNAAGVAPRRAEETSLEESGDEVPSTRFASAEKSVLQTKAVAAQPKPAPKKEQNFDDDEESLSYFAKLANDD
jgi:hypothetical protein